MTEAEWLGCTDPGPMLDFLRGTTSKRKRRLLIVGFCRHVWDLLSEWGRRPVEMAERFADGHATTQELEEARWTADSNVVEEDGLHQQAELDRSLARSPEDEELFLRELRHRQGRLLAAMLAHTSTFPDEWLEPRELHTGGSWKTAAGLVRCLSGNPYHPLPTIDPSWLAWNGGTIPKLAEVIYNDRAFDRLPVLADALEDAGCTEAEILAHCRSGGDHVRGCWVVDVLLGKE
jgi:hypothetical protein